MVAILVESPGGWRGVIGLLCLNGTDKVNIMSQDQITNHCFSKQLKVLNTCRLSALAESLSLWNKYYLREIL